MDLIADILLAAGAFGAGFYCFVLSRRLSRFNDLEKGVGGAVASLSTSSLDGLTERAEGVAKRLELLVASMHDLPEADAAPMPTGDTNGETPLGPIFRRRATGVGGQL